MLMDGRPVKDKCLSRHIGFFCAQMDHPNNAPPERLCVSKQGRMPVFLRHSHIIVPNGDGSAHQIPWIVHRRWLLALHPVPKGFDAGKEAVGFRVVVFAQLVELFQKLFLPGSQVHRRFYGQLNEHVTLGTAA